VKLKFAANLVLFLLALPFVTANSSAQTIRYRQTNLSSNIPNKAKNVTQDLVNPWGLAFHPREAFFIANNTSGIVTSHDETGASIGLAHFSVPNAAGTGLDNPTGMVVDENSSFEVSGTGKPFILVSDSGLIFTWGADAQGNFPPQAVIAKNNSATGAVYKGVAILNSPQTNPALAVTNFHDGSVEAFLRGFDRVALSGSFTDPNLPAGFAPFGIQVIGNQVFVTYALQDAAKHDPVFGAGNGVVSIFDLEGNFVRRFATGGPLNAPWGVVKAGANFGPFSNDILIGNVGDGTIVAFNPANGNFVGALGDGDGFDLVLPGIHDLTFRTDNFGDPNTLYFTSDLTNEADGLFGAFTTGLVSTTRVTAPNTQENANITITANVTAGPGNPGAPTGNVTFLDGSTRLGTKPIVNGVATLATALTGVRTHNITALYEGDPVFLPSSDNIPVEVSAAPDFIVTPTPIIATVTGGQSVPFAMAIASAGGFAENVTFSCSQVTGITCTFDPPTVTPTNGIGRSILTVTTSASVPVYGLLTSDLNDFHGPFIVLVLAGVMIWGTGKFSHGRISPLAATAAFCLVALTIGLGGCGGYGNSSKPNRGTAAIVVTANSGAISHSTTIRVTVQ